MWEDISVYRCEVFQVYVQPQAGKLFLVFSGAILRRTEVYISI